MNQSKIEINLDRFALIVEDALATYSKYSPHEERSQILIGTPRSYTFNSANSPNGVPDWISECNTARIISVVPYMFRQQDSGLSSELQVNAQVPWIYRKPVLTVPYSGEWQILAIYKHRLVETNMPDGKIEKECKTISIDDQDLFKLIQAKFMQGLGRSRRAFTMSDLPITMDASELSSEGNTLEDQALEAIKLNAKFYLSFGG